VRVTEFKTKIELAREMLDVLKGYFRVSRVVFDSSTVQEARDGQRGVKAQVQPSPGSAQGTLEEGHLPVGYSWSLLRRPDPGRPSDYGEVARRNTTPPGHMQGGTSTRPTSRSAGGGLPGGRSRSSTGTSRPWDSSFSVDPKSYYEK